ncbi:MAG: hypothetical protein LBR73_00790 [Oscillospiraceae bacterium]|jgi:hypothetical protein|nr:hypothetical protein [Oscillospiraceae bacterium]
MKKFLFYLVHWTWGLAVNLPGLIVYLLLKRKGCASEPFGKDGCNAYITYLPWDKGGISLGLFICMRKTDNAEWTHNTRIHEYGHTWQCLLLGPLYWLVIGIPSFVWCNAVFPKLKAKQPEASYYDFYPESWANAWGERGSGQSRTISDT